LFIEEKCRKWQKFSMDFFITLDLIEKEWQKWQIKNIILHYINYHNINRNPNRRGMID